MSASALHRHFKAVTAMTPLQYQKELRVREARSQMLGAGLDAATAGHRVGYASPSQFSREYTRVFGAPPARDVARLRERHGGGLSRRGYWPLSRLERGVRLLTRGHADGLGRPEADLLLARGEARHYGVGGGAHGHAERVQAHAAEVGVDGRRDDLDHGDARPGELVPQRERERVPRRLRRRVDRDAAAHGANARPRRNVHDGRAALPLQVRREQRREADRRLRG